MSSKATTIEEQIRLLLQRGMRIDSIARAKEYLLDIGYNTPLETVINDLLSVKYVEK